MEVNIIMDLR